MNTLPLRTDYKINNIYIINQESPLKFGNSEIIIGEPDKSLLFSGQARRFNIEKLRLLLQIIYFKSLIAYRIANCIFTRFSSEIQNTQAEQNNETLSICVKRERFFKILETELEADDSASNFKGRIKDFDLALDILERKRTVIILIGGTSGCGKSTVASFLASRFGISTVLSTDTIRHILRNFLSAEDYPVLFASTYEAGTKIKMTEETKDLSPKKRTLKGYLEQARLVQERLLPVIASFQKKNESLVVEGVHLTPDFMIKVMAKYGNCIPFVISISNESKHKERFAIRSKYMTLEKNLNKYVANFASIRYIHKHLVKKADEYLVPKIDNTNVDKSIGIIHKTILRCLRKIALENLPLYSKETKKARLLHETFNRVTKNVWSSKAVKEYIEAKANKSPLMSNFLKTAANIDNLEVDPEEKELSKPTQHLPKPQEVSRVDQTKLLPSKPYLQKSLSDDSLNKNFLADASRDEIEEEKNMKSRGLQATHGPELSPKIKEDSKMGPTGGQWETAQLHDKQEAPSATEKNQKLSLRDLEEYIEKYNYVSIPRRLGRSHQKNIMRFIMKFNGSHQGQKLKLKQTSQKYFIFKVASDDMREIKLKPHENLGKKKTRFEESQQSANGIESCNHPQGISMPYSDQGSVVSGEEDVSVDALDKNNERISWKSESMDVNVHGKSFKAASDRILELSDDSELENLKGEDSSPDMQDPFEMDSVNSISEEDDEQDSDSEH